MPVSVPTLQELKTVAERLNMSFSPEDLESFRELIKPNIEAYELLDSLEDNLPAPASEAPDFCTAGESENTLNAWFQKTALKTQNHGILEGKRIVLKDNISLAGVPMMNGASTLADHVPNIDATVVTRILNAGGEIAGKAHCEYFCLSGGSHTTALGPVHNPHDHNRSSGGSSAGCGALVGSGELEFAIGGDQGGSIRIPSAWCGCVGMKPTWGLVPYTGIMPIEATIDNAGPITNNVYNNALLLEAIAGADGLDPRQYDVKTQPYSQQLRGGVEGMRIGLVKEGFDRPESEADIDQKVRKAANALRDLGAIVTEVSIPWHNIGQSVWLAIALEGLTEQMMLRNGTGLNWKGLYDTQLLQAHANWRERADELSDSLKSCMLTGLYMLEKYHGYYYAKAQNLNRRLRTEYDSYLQDYDLLMMPTVPMKATPLPAPDASREEYIQRAFEMIGNTCAMDATGHPALSVPCGLSEGLPVGMMFVGRHYDESTLYRAAYAFESHYDWHQF
jgi:amidase